MVLLVIKRTSPKTKSVLCRNSEGNIYSRYMCGDYIFVRKDNTVRLSAEINPVDIIDTFEKHMLNCYLNMYQTLETDVQKSVLYS